MQPSKAETLCRHSEKTGGATCSVDRKWYFCAHSASLSCPVDTKKRGRRREQSGAYEATLALAVKRRKELNKKNSTDGLRAAGK